MDYRLKLLIGIAILALTGCTQEKVEEVIVPGEQITTVDQQVDERESLEVDGTVKLLEKKELFLEFPATIEAVYVQENDNIKKGESLLRFSFDDYKEEMDQTESEIARLENEAVSYENHINVYKTQEKSLQEELKLQKYYKEQQADPEINTLQIRVESGQEAVKLAQADYEAAQQLLEAGGVSQKEVETLEQQWHTKENDVTALKNNIQTLETARDLKIVSLTAQLEAVQANMKDSDQQVTYSLNETHIKLEQAKKKLVSMQQKLTKPGVEGNELIATDDHYIVNKIKCAAGTRISGSGNTLIELMDRNSMVIELEVPVEKGYEVSIGQEVIIKGEHGAEAIGTISTILQEVVDDDDDYIPVQVILQEDEMEFMQNQKVKAQIILENR